MSRGEKLEDMNLSEEKAKMILEAMKNSEIQYIQQNKRNATKKPDSNKPDW
jgi:Ca-activated chloride channel homolog